MAVDRRDLLDVWGGPDDVPDLDLMGEDPRDPEEVPDELVNGPTRVIPPSVS